MNIFTVLLICHCLDTCVTISPSVQGQVAHLEHHQLDHVGACTPEELTEPEHNFNPRIHTDKWNEE